MIIFFNCFIYFFNFDIILLILHLLSIVLTYFLSMISLLLGMIECTYLTFVASRAITVDSFVFIGVVQPLHRRMTFVAKQALRALLPARVGPIRLALHVFAIFRNILEDLRRPSKVSHMMSVDAALRIMRVLLVWTPA